MTHAFFFFSIWPMPLTDETRLSVSESVATLVGWSPLKLMVNFTNSIYFFFVTKYLTYSDVSLMMCRESGLMDVGSWSSASARSISSPVSRFRTLICFRIS